MQCLYKKKPIYLRKMYGKRGLNQEKKLTKGPFWLFVCLFVCMTVCFKKHAGGPDTSQDKLPKTVFYLAFLLKHRLGLMKVMLKLKSLLLHTKLPFSETIPTHPTPSHPHPRT